MNNSMDTIKPVPGQNDIIQFAESHRVSLYPGKYQLTVKHQLTGDEIGQGDPWENTHQFAVMGERYQLPAQAIRAVFPPKGSQGDYWHVLPHLILERSTLPWERSSEREADPSSGAPWLALLVFHEGEEPVVTQEQRVREDLNHEEERVNIINVPEEQLPSLEDVKNLTHIRRRLAEIEPDSETESDFKTKGEAKSAIPHPLEQLHEYELTSDDEKKAFPTGVSQGWIITDDETKEHYEILKFGENSFKLYHVAHEAATLIANRLPRPGRKNTVHLVSLEGRLPLEDDDDLKFFSLYQWSFRCEVETKNFKGLFNALDKADWHMVTPYEILKFDVNSFKLYRVEKSSRILIPNDFFSTLEQAKSAIPYELDQLNENELTNDEDNPFADGVSKKWIITNNQNDEQYEVLKFDEDSFRLYLIENGNSILIPNDSNDSFSTREQAKLAIPGSNDKTWHYFNSGAAPLRHFFREGSRSISWYRGPLNPINKSFDASTPFSDGTSLNTEARHADELLQFNKSQGVFDVTYAAAWQLGRMLTLQNTDVALQVYNWKRAHAHQLHAVRHLADYGYPLANGITEETIDPDITAIQNWLDDLGLLKHIPFNYLVPNEAMLPKESIRFFQIDPLWIAFLRDGAFSIGRVTEQDADIDVHLKQQKITREDKTYTGFIMRSELISGWPDMQIAAYKTLPLNTEEEPYQTNPKVIHPIRTERLSPQVLLMLFEEEVVCLDFYLTPDTLHFGFDLSSESTEIQEPDDLVINLRNPENGELMSNDPISLTDVVDNASLSINTAALITDLKGEGEAEIKSNTLALQLVAGSDLIRIKAPAKI